MSYAFIFEKDNKDHGSGSGLLVLSVWMFVLVMPNLFILGGKFHIKDNYYFQLAPFILGAGIYIIFQLVPY